MKTILLIFACSLQIMAFSQADSIYSGKQKGEPFEGIDGTWANGSDRRQQSIFKNLKYFTPSVLIDVNYTHSFNSPNDNTVVGSTALARNNEINLSALHFGGDFYYKGARARFMTSLEPAALLCHVTILAPTAGNTT